MPRQIPAPRIVRWHLVSVAAVLIFRIARAAGFWPPLLRAAVRLSLAADRHFPRRHRRTIGGGL